MKRKIIIKGKKLKSAEATSTSSIDVGEVSDEDEAADIDDAAIQAAEEEQKNDKKKKKKNVSDLG